MLGRKRISLFVLMYFISSILFCVEAKTKPIRVKGIVFHDTNRNGVFDKGESGIPKVGISAQFQIVETNDKGKFIIDVSSIAQFVSVIKPSGYAFQQSQSFYYSVKQLAGIKTLFIPMIRDDQENNHKAILLGDPQVPDQKRLDFFRKGCIEKMCSEVYDFSLVLGDIADDNLDILKDMKESFDALPSRTYFVPGNHDRDLDSDTCLTHFSSYKNVFGPDYYSFNYGNIHYVVLNNIDYEGYDMINDKPGQYFGGLDDVQLQWLKNDLHRVEDDKLIVVASHIPFLEEFCNTSTIDSLFSLLQRFPKVISVSGHLHTTKSWQFNNDTRWYNDSYHEGLVVNAGCGSWWTEPFNEFGVPVATCMDGSPRGYFVFDVNHTDYTYRLSSFEEADSYQIRISTTSSLQNDSINVVANWFTGKPTEKLTISINNGEEIEMANYTGIDPFIESTIQLRSNVDNWTPSLQNTDHLWKGDVLLSKELSLQKVEVVAYRNGKAIHRAVKLIRTTDNKSKL